MSVPIRCKACGKVIAPLLNKYQELYTEYVKKDWNTYRENMGKYRMEIAKWRANDKRGPAPLKPQSPQERAMNDAGLRRQCCRAIAISPIVEPRGEVRQFETIRDIDTSETNNYLMSTYGQPKERQVTVPRLEPKGALDAINNPPTDVEDNSDDDDILPSVIGEVIIPRNTVPRSYSIVKQ